MHRIDSINARPNQNGIGKNGFNDNADLNGADSTYLSPDWFNDVQENISVVIENSGLNLIKGKFTQLWDALVKVFATNDDLDALAVAIDSKLNSETQKRINADALLQSNIDAVLAQLAVINNQVNVLSNIIGSGVYGVGKHLIYILPNQQKTIQLWGAGGGGGMSYTGGYAGEDAKDGGDSSITINGAIYTVGGGKAGTQGVWGNGSAYSNGVGGAGGIYNSNSSQNVVTNSMGQVGMATRENQAGGKPATILDTYGCGGAGAAGAGDDGWSFGGGGGSGAYCELLVKNTSDSPMLISVIVGAGGASPIHVGMDGICVVKS